jgi:L-aspartate oxidase
MWRSAGLVRDPERLRTLLEDPHPLARIVAACALHRVESRGAHARTDAPGRDDALDHRHTVVAPGGAVTYERWD